MSAGLVLLVPALAVVAALAVVLAAMPHRRALVAVNRARLPGLGELRRSTGTSRVLAVAVGVAASAVVAVSVPLGRGLMLVPAVFAAVQVVAILASDLATRDAGGPGRRRAGGTAGQGLPAAAAHRPHGPGRGGSRRAAAVGHGHRRDGRRRSRRPGAALHLPLRLLGGRAESVARFVLLRAARAGPARCRRARRTALRATARRPRNGTDREIVRVDGLVRRRAGESVTASAGFAVAGSLAGVGLASGVRLVASGGDHLPIALQVMGWVVLSAGLAALVLAAWCVVVLLTPGAGLGGSGGGAHGDNDATRP